MEQDATKRLEKLLRLPVTFFSTPTLTRRAYDLATAYNQPTAYDAQYLAVAEHLRCDLWTTDQRLYNALHKQTTYTKWLGNYRK